MRIDSLIVEIIEDSDIYSYSQKEIYIDALGDPIAQEFDKLIREVNKKIDQNFDCPIISLTDEADGYFIEKLLGDHFGLYQKVIDRIESYEKFEKKGECGLRGFA